MSLATYCLEYGRHVARLRRRRRRRRRRRAYAPTSNTASHDSHDKINPWVSFAFLHVFEYGAPPGGPSGRRSSAITKRSVLLALVFYYKDMLEKVTMQKEKKNVHQNKNSLNVKVN